MRKPKTPAESLAEGKADDLLHDAEEKADDLIHTAEQTASELITQAATDEAMMGRLERLAEGQDKIFGKIQQDRRRWSWFAFGVLCAGVVFAIVYFNQQDVNDRLSMLVEQQQEQFDEFTASRAQAQMTACNDANYMRIAHNRLTLDLAGFDPATGQPAAGWLSLTEERRVEYRPRLVRNLVELRVCSDPDEIAAFYASNGTEGTVAIDPTGDDFAETVVAP